MKRLKIAFFGTPEFAVPTLDALYKHGFDICGVISSPPKPAGRGRKLLESPVSRYAHEHHLKLLQPEKLKSPSFNAEMDNIAPDLQVIVAFRMLPEMVWNRPPLGSINLHASLLPQYRGAAPINWAIIRGETQTGLTTFFLKHQIDTGDILLQKEIPIEPDENAGSLHDKMMLLGAELTLETVLQIEQKNYSQKPQREVIGSVNTAPKIFKDMCEINWNKSAYEVKNFVRGLAPIPGAWTLINEKKFKVLKVEMVPSEIMLEKIQVGNFHTDQKAYLYFQTQEGFISIQELQKEGKSKMDIRTFFRGNQI